MALCNQKRYNLDFEVYGEGFPSGRIDGSFKLRSAVEQIMTIDYNDGTDIVKYRIEAGTWTTIRNYTYIGDVDDETDLDAPPLFGPRFYRGRTFQDGNSGDRIVTVGITDPSAITGFSSSLVQEWKGVFPVNILKYTNITEFYCKYAPYLESLPEDLITLTKLTTLDLSGTFGRSSVEYMQRELPSGFLNMALTSLTLSNLIRLDLIIDNGLNSNLEHIDLLKDSLKTLRLSSSYIHDRIMPSDIIEALSRCENLRTFDFNTNRYTRIPDYLNNLTQIDYITVGGGYSYDSTLTDFGDLSSLINLKTFYCPVATNCPTAIPSYFRAMNKLVKVNFDGSYYNQERWDIWVDNLYNEVTTYAAITDPGGNFDTPLRNMNISCSRFNDTYIVQGIHQQPAGYVQGVSNGTPTTQLEKFWVLQNQYNIKVDYTDNRP